MPVLQIKMDSQFNVQSQYHLPAQSGLCPEPRGLALLFPGGKDLARKKAACEHCLPEIRHGARDTPQCCTILHGGKGTVF